jgi:hypothetical protein
MKEKTLVRIIKWCVFLLTCGLWFITGGIYVANPTVFAEITIIFSFVMGWFSSMMWAILGE